MAKISVRRDEATREAVFRDEHGGEWRLPADVYAEFVRLLEAEVNATWLTRISGLVNE